MGINYPRLVDITVGGLLICAAWLKLYEHCFAFDQRSLIIGSVVATQLVVFGELSLGLLLIGNRSQRYRWRGVALGVFAIFASVALINTVNGSTSCGCFGVIRIRPQLMLVTNVFVALILASTFAIMGRDSMQKDTWNAKFVALAVGLIIVLCGFPRYLVTDIGSLQDVENVSNLAALTPQSWIHKEFPLSRCIKSDCSIGSGTWVVLVVRSECGICNTTLLTLSSQLGFHNVGSPIMVLDASATPRNISAIGALGRFATLKDKCAWLAETPVLIYLQDNKVIEVIVEPDCLSNVLMSEDLFIVRRSMGKSVYPLYESYCDEPK